MSIYILQLPNGNLLSVPSTALVYARCLAEERGYPADLPLVEILSIEHIVEHTIITKKESPVLEHGA